MSEATVETIWDRDKASPYQTKVKLSERGLRLHIFYRGDADPDMHDHPADFWTFPLVSYVERIPHPWSRGHYALRVVKAFRPHFRKAEYVHLVEGSYEGMGEVIYNTPSGAQGRMEPTVGNRPIVTLVWWGKKRREWGFHTATGWVPWQEYVA